MSGPPPRIVPASAEWLALRRALVATPVPCQQTPDLWISDDAEERAVAAELCAGCPLLEECNAAAVANKEEFVWGGQDFTKPRRQVVRTA